MKNKILKFTRIKAYFIAFVTTRFDLLYLKYSDCDGMCNHCNLELKSKCLLQKSFLNL